jgi:hypothetical protein
MATKKKSAGPTPCVWIINVASRNYDWVVVADSRKECLQAFKAVWLDWCRATGADRNYWGSDFGDVEPSEVKMGVVYMDRNLYQKQWRG